MIRVTKCGTQPSWSGPEAWFTGKVRIDPLFATEDTTVGSGGSVTFEPGARTAWHRHPLGQTLIVTAGSGFVQSWGQPKQLIQPGDVVWIPANEKHWHGAAATTAMTHIAIQEAQAGEVVTWLEHVSDSQYQEQL